MPNNLTPAVEEALFHLKALADFAYQQGFHELGYDPVEAVRAALAATVAPAPVSEAQSPESGTAPDGHVVLPRRMTPAMRLVAVKLRMSASTSVEGIYGALLDAAPRLPVPSTMPALTEAKLRDAVTLLRGALVSAESAIKGREHTGFITKALNATAFPPSVANPVSASENLEEALCNVLEQFTELSTDAIDERVPKMVALAAPSVRPVASSCSACGAAVGERCRARSEDQCDAGQHMLGKPPGDSQ